MPLDTSSYYPEVNQSGEHDQGESLNGRHNSLFGEEKPEQPKDNDPGPAPDSGKNYPDSGEKVVERGPVYTLFDNISHFLSWIFVPLIVPVYGIIFIFKLSVLDAVPAGMQTAVCFVIAGINFMAPMLMILLLKLLGLVQDVGLNGQKERFLPYIITALCYGGSAWFVASRGAPVWVAMFFAAGALAALINMGINFKWKISAHAAGMAGLVALLIRLQRDVAVEPELFVWLLITVGMTGLLGSARVWLGRHTVWQVLAGYAVGFCSVFFLMYIH